MTDVQLRKAGGAALRVMREQREWSLTDEMNQGEPHYQTVDATERGELEGARRGHRR